MTGPKAMRKPVVAIPLLAALSLTLLASPGVCQDWSPFNPFANTKPKPPPKPERPAAADTDAIMFEPLDDASRAVERTELSPVMANDGSGLPFELWRGLDVRTLETLIAELEIPPRSPALYELWRRLITSNVTPPDGGSANQHFLALRLEALYRSGLLDDAARELANLPQSDPLVATLAARNEIGVGAKEQGCQTAARGGPLLGNVPKHIKAQAALISGYCAAVAGDKAGASLAAELAREQGLSGTAGLKALDSLSFGGPPPLTSDKRVSLLDYRILEVAGSDVRNVDLINSAAPSLLAALALDPNSQPAIKLAAAEAAAQRSVITPQELASVYRASASSTLPGAPPPTGFGASGNPEQRAQLFVAAEQERTPQRKVRLIRSFLDEARRAGLYLVALRMIAPSADTIVPAPEIGWFAETGIETALASGNYERARNWVEFSSAVDHRGGPSLLHWLALIDLTDDKTVSDRGASLAYVEDLAVRGRLDPNLLHRLATVLDALEYHVPIPLWEAASRTPQPSGGHLPETGVLSELQNAAKRREFGRTVLLAMKTLGPNGAEGAHMIALGDSMRALKRAGLEADARKVGFEALFASWPRTVTN